MLGLDFLPWPWGEDIAARLFMAAYLMRGSQRRRALTWAKEHGGSWRLAAAVCAFRGRRLARARLLGRRHPDELRPHLVLRGEEHLGEAKGGTILLGFHLGPASGDIALRILGQRLAWLGGRRVSRGWSRAAWRPFLEASQNLSPSGNGPFWPGLTYRARKILLDGGTVFVIADTGSGRDEFRVDLPGRTMFIRSAWLLLHRHTGARVLPVLTHLEGRTQVVTIHPPLPDDADARDEREEHWRRVLSGLLEDYVRRFPEQCPNIVFQAERH